jgi:hypothetical protein
MNQLKKSQMKFHLQKLGKVEVKIVVIKMNQKIISKIAKNNTLNQCHRTPIQVIRILMRIQLKLILITKVIYQ